MLVDNITPGKIVCMFGPRGCGKTTCAKQLCMLNQFDKTVVFTFCPDQWLAFETHDTTKMTAAEFEQVLQSLIDDQKAGSNSLVVVFDQAWHLTFKSKQVQFLAYNSRWFSTAVIFVEQLPKAVPCYVRHQADIVMSGRFNSAKSGGKIYREFSQFESLSNFQAAQPGNYEFMVADSKTVEYYTPGSELHARM